MKNMQMRRFPRVSNMQMRRFLSPRCDFVVVVFVCLFVCLLRALCELLKVALGCIAFHVVWAE